MKLKKIISSLLVAVMAISMSVVSFADGETKYLYFGQAEYEDGQNVTVDLYLHEDVKKVSGFSQVIITYSADAYRFVSGSTVVSTAAVSEYEDGIVAYIDEDAAEKTIADPTVPFITMEFEVEDPAKIGEVPFSVCLLEEGYTTINIIFEDSTKILLDDAEDQKYTSDMTVTKKAPVTPEPPVQEEPEAGDIKTEETVLSENKKFLEIYDNNTQPRYVAIEEKSDVAVTATTVLKATYNGTTKQANLYNLLGVDEEARGNITIGKLTIKMVLPLNSAQPTDSIFNFVIQ